MITFQPYDRKKVATWREGQPDDNGQVPEIAVSDGGGNPCRSCLRDIPEGTEMLVVGARPFAQLNPYAECGPIFLCKTECEQFSGAELPPILATSPDYLVKAYSADDRIIYGTGQITPSKQISNYAQILLKRREVAYVDVRSARNNCFQLRVTRAPP